MKEVRLNSGIKEDLLKVIVNDDDECIYLNPNDSTFMDRFAKFLSWLDVKSRELEKIGEDKAKQYEGKDLVSEDGDIDIDQLLEMTDIQLGAVKEISEEVDKLFGQDTLKKFYKPYYSINPEFVPDADCINDFLEQIIPQINVAYNARVQRIQSKYNKGRRKK